MHTGTQHNINTWKPYLKVFWVFIRQQKPKQYKSQLLITVITRSEIPCLIILCCPGLIAQDQLLKGFWLIPKARVMVLLSGEALEGMYSSSFHFQDLGFCRFCNFLCVFIWLWVWFLGLNWRTLTHSSCWMNLKVTDWFIQFPRNYSWVYLQSWIHVKFLSAKRLIMRLYSVWCNSFPTCWISWSST